MRLSLQGTEFFREDFNVDENNLPASNPDFGGTLAYQGSRIGIPFFTESRVGTTLPHSEYVYYGRDPESFFSELSNTANWDPLSRDMSGIAVPTPTTTDPDNESTWHRQTFSGGAFLPFGTIGGLWRMDRGPCSIEIPKAAIIQGGKPDRNDAIPFFGIEDIPFDTDLQKFEGVGYVSHPVASGPGLDHSGGVLVNIKGRAVGNGLADFFADVITSIITGLSFGIAGFSVPDVNFDGTAALRLDINNGMVFMSHARPPVVSARNAESCGCEFRLGIPFIDPLFECNFCLNNEVASSLRGTLQGAPDEANPLFESCQAVPIPALDSGTVSCTTVSDCGPALATLQLLNTAQPAGGQVQPDNTVRGLSADVRTALQPQLSLDNFRCAPVRPECGALTSSGGTAPTGNVCQFVLRAKRINHYVDTAEIVWFDEVDKALVNTVNSSLALFGAIDGLPQAATLCQPQSTARRRRNAAHITAEDI